MSLLDIIYPRRCVGCRTLLKLTEDRWLCGKCARDFVFVRDKYEFCCKICGRPIEHEGKCVFCNMTDIYYGRGMCLYDYEGAVRAAVLRFKLGGRYSFAEFFGGKMAEYLTCPTQYNAVTYVPMFSADKRVRGYNQSQLLAERISKITNIPCQSLLIKSKKTKHQRSLKKDERKSNIRGAFKVSANVKGMNILIVDDIITTGYTINECCKMLKRAGAANVDFFVLCSRGI